jgi:hypothetical protein
MIEGPYGCLRPLRQFDSVVLLAGSTGATFTLPLLRDIVQGWIENASFGKGDNKTSFFGRQPGAATRYVRFIWVVKSKGQLSWLAEQLSSICMQFQPLQERLRDIKLELKVYVTCDESFTEEHKSLLSTFTAPTHDTVPKSDNEYGTVEYRGRPHSGQGVEKSEKETVRELTQVESQSSDRVETSCGPNGTCCCRSAVDENSPDSVATCCCPQPSNQKSQPKSRRRPLSNVSSTPSSTKQKPIVHPAITIYSGRPKTKDIIRQSLEQALGESAVVVCGPQGLVADVKQDVCELSDERAVHKGTGAQGIYLHTESYSY